MLVWYFAQVSADGISSENKVANGFVFEEIFETSFVLAATITDEGTRIASANDRRRLGDLEEKFVALQGTLRGIF